MDRIHARYPFLQSAKQAVEEADIDVLALIEEDDPALDRALERVRGAITRGRVAAPGSDIHTEVLSYPIARVLISLVDDPVLTDRYALAEARRAFELFSDELDEHAPTLRSTDRDDVTVESLLAEFDLADRVRPTDDGFDLGVTAYLNLSAQLREPRWRLVNRGLADGWVPIRQDELESLLQEAVRLRVAEGLPLDVPDPIADALADEVAEIETSLASVTIPADLDRVEPDAFPDCMQRLLSRTRAGESLSSLERFVLVSFLCCIGASAADVLQLLEITEEEAAADIRYTVQHVHGQTRSTAYPPPSSDTLAALDLCDGTDACAEHGHPIAAYAAALSGA